MKDRRGRALIKSRLDRISLGNFGDSKSIGGGISELRINCVRKSTGQTTGTGPAPRSIAWESYLIQSLKDPKEAEAYLNAALDDDDPRVFLLALRHVAEARGGMSKIARICKLNRESLYRTLSKKGNPSLRSLGALLSSLGFRLAVEKKGAA